MQWSSQEWVTTYGEDWDWYPVVRGCFWARGSAKISQITDGTSNTVAVFENHHYRFRERPALLTTSTAWISPESSIDGAEGVINKDHTSDLTGTNANGWDQDPRCAGWQSVHDGGAHALMADGSVRFVAENIDWNTVQRAIATASAGDIVGEF